MKWLVFGANGWIGGQLTHILQSIGETVIPGECRADNEKDFEGELLRVHPDRVVSLIGRTHGPGHNTIDYLEQQGKLIENLRDNLYAPLAMALVCKKLGYHFTYIGTGCIFNGYEGEDGNGYTEESHPDFFGSSYSTVKGVTDRLMHFFDGDVLNLRIRMPCDNKPNARNYITKLMRYQRICSIPNSVTVLPELLPIAIDLAKNKVTGTVNLTNPGLVSHNEILEMVREIIDPEFTWKNFTLEEQGEILAAGRSNNLLNTTKLQTLYPTVLPARESIRKLIEELKENM